MRVKREIIIISIISGLVCLILFFIFVCPCLKSIKQGPLELINAKKQLDLFREKAGNLENLKKSYEEVKPDLEKINQLFVESESPISLIKFWEATAYGSGLKINISPLSPDKNKTDLWDSIMFRLSLSGSFNNLMRFLEKVEAGPYLVEVRSLNIKTSDLSLEGLPSGSVKADLLIKVFVK